MAYAELAGLPPTAGLYALLAPAVAYTLLGSSRQLIVGPEGSLAALSAAAVLGMAAGGSARAAELGATLALLTGACFGIARLLQLGWTADYLSRPVLVGYIHGVAVVLVCGQLGKLVGVDVTARDPVPQLVELVRDLGSLSPPTAAVGVGSLAVLLALRAFAPRVPAALVVVVAGIVLSAAADLAAHGVAVVGEIPAGLPSVTLPAAGLDDVAELAPAALGLFFVCFADAILTARSFAGRHGEHVSVNSELLALGAANAAAGVTQGMVVGASGSRTAVNDAMGVRSQVSGLLAAGAVLGVLVFLTGPIADLPKTVLAAVIIAAAIGLVEPPQWRALWASDRVEFTIAAVAGAGVVLTGVLEAIVFAVGLSLVDVVRRSARPHDAVLGWVPELGRWADVAVHADAVVTPGVVVYRLDDRLFFANTRYVRGRVREALRGAPSEPTALVLDAESMTDVDTAGLDLLGRLSEDLGRDGIALHVARMHATVAERLERTGVADRIGRGRFHSTVRAAVDAAMNPGGR